MAVQRAFATLAARSARGRPEEALSRSLTMPVYQSTVYAFEDLGRLEALNQGAPGSSYYRYGTPNGSALEAIRQNAALLEFAPSLADVTTTVSYPIATSHQGLPDTALADLQVGAEMIRLSAGIEEPADVIADLDAALAATM